MKVLQGKYECKCGKSFDWKTFALEDGEAAVYHLNKVELNAHKFGQDTQNYFIEVVCPYCNERETILIAKL